MSMKAQKSGKDLGADGIIKTNLFAFRTAFSHSQGSTTLDLLKLNQLSESRGLFFLVTDGTFGLTMDQPKVP